VSRVAESWQGEPRDLEEWLTAEEETVCALLGRRVLSLHGHLDTRSHHLMAVAAALQFVRDAPIDPRDTLRTLASALRDNVSSARLPADAHRDAQVFLLHVERILDWVANG
jgi:hypothetical protein